MTPGARVQAAIELIEAIGGTDAPADGIVERFVRARRYMGSKDRRSVTGRVYGILRRYGRLSWWLAEYAVTSRALVLADLALHPDEREADFDALFSGLGHAPEALDEEEQALAARLSGQTFYHSDMPDWVVLEYPDWLDGPLKSAFGEAHTQEMTALNSPAPLDLRVNIVRTDVNGARKVLADEQIKTETTQYSPIAIRVRDRINLRGSRAFREGLIEVQDEGSQIISALCGAQPGMSVVDYCAGAGGKTLALAAMMAGEGIEVDTLWACDTQEKFLGRLSKRTARAGVEGIQQHVLAEKDDVWIAENKGFADVVLVDAPCSGMGTWRRNPGAKWQMSAERLDESVARQAEILENAASLVRPGGRMVYATCSLLREENEDRIETFLAAHPEFAPIPVSDIWTKCLDSPCPSTGTYLRLSPATTGTDGFFAAVLTRLD